MIRRAIKICSAIFASIGLNACADIGHSGQDGKLEGFVVHAHRDRGDIATYAYIVETSNHSVLIDAGFSAVAGEEIQTMLSDIGKPVAAVLLTHAHPGHYGGVTAAVGDDIPVLAGVGVARQFSEYDKKFGALTGGLMPTIRRGADVIYGHGQSLTVDAVNFTLNVMGPGEAEVDTWWRVSDGDQEAAFTGGLTTYEVHPILTGHSGAWIRSLGIMKREIVPETPIYPGYNPNAKAPSQPFGYQELLDWQIQYLTDYRNAVATVAQNRVIMTDGELSEVENRMRALYPDNRSSIFVTLGAETVAAELALEAALKRADDRLRSLFGG